MGRRIKQGLIQMAKQTVADFVVERLLDWKVERIFGYSGDGINGVMGALNKREDAPEFIQVRHEESAAFMACAHSKFTNGTGVCMATGGPGAIHLLNGLYDAKLDHQPVLAIIGQKPRYGMGSNTQQEVNLAGLFADVSDYVETVNVAEQAPVVLDRALRIARGRRCVTTVILPSDVQELEMPDSHHTETRCRTIRTGLFRTTRHSGGVRSGRRRRGAQLR